jgi:hypothetical protein
MSMGTIVSDHTQSIQRYLGPRGVRGQPPMQPLSSLQRRFEFRKPPNLSWVGLGFTFRERLSDRCVSPTDVGRR